LENKLKASEENREIIIKKTKEDVAAYLSKVEQKVRDLEVTTEAEKIAKKIAMDADVMKVDQKRSEQLEKRIKELQDHEDYVKHVLASQEMKKKNYLANLESSGQGVQKEGGSPGEGRGDRAGGGPEDRRGQGEERTE